MQQPTTALHEAETSGTPPPAASVAPVTALPATSPLSEPNAFAEEHAKKPKRTLGLKLFDVMVYPLFNNISVFLVSVLFTYLGKYGGKLDASGNPVHGWVGQMLSKRGDACINGFKKLMPQPAAEGATLVLWSFLDGSAFAVAVKLLEDRREKIAQWIDARLGTQPADDRAYDAEPKQTWGSVLAGRFLTAGIVVPTAMLLEKKGFHQKFYEWGDELGNKFTKKTNIQSVGAWEVGKVAHISIFEAIYTTICTAGLYFTSRFIARRHTWGEQDELNIQKLTMKQEAPTTQVRAREPAAQETAPANTPPSSEKAAPAAHIAHFSSQGRIHEAPALAQAT